MDDTRITTTDLRPEVRWFASEMEKRLRANDHKGGWQEEEQSFFVERMFDELMELIATMEFANQNTKQAVLSKLMETKALLPKHHMHSHRPARTVHEAADLANFAMMLADVVTRRGL